MFYDVFRYINQVVTTYPFVYFGCVTAVSIFMFWRSVQRTFRRELDDDTDEETAALGSDYLGRRVFDLLILTSFSALLIARLSFILYQPESLSGVRWFLLPYERIEGEVFLFASLPWYFFKFVDGVLTEGFILGWLVSIVFYSRLMQIKWGTISNAVSDFMWFWFIGAGIYLAISWNMIVVVGFVVYLIVLGFIRFMVNRRGDRKSQIHKAVSFIWKGSLIVGIPAVMFINNLFIRDVDRNEFLAVLSGVTCVVGIWILAGDAFEFFDIFKDSTKGVFIRKHEKAAALEKEEIVVPDVPSEQGWRRFTVENPGMRVKKRDRQGAPRDFSLSYKHFSRRWVDVIQVLWARLFRRRGGGSGETHGREK